MEINHKNLKIILGIMATLFAYCIFSLRYLVYPPVQLINENVVGIGLTIIVVFFLLTKNEWQKNFSLVKVESKTIFVFLVIFSLAVFLRFYDLSNIPPGVHGDEGEWGLIELKVLKGEFKEFFSLAQQGIYFDFSLLSFATQAIFIKIFGANIFGVRASSAFAGAFSLIPFYLLAKEWLSKRGALFASFCFAVSHWAIAYSRLGISNIWTVFWELWLFLFLFKGIRKNSRLDFSLAGIFLGLGLYFHHTFKAVPIILGIFFCFLLIKEKKQFLKRLAPLACFLGIALLAFLPQLIYYWQNPGSFTARMDEVSILNRLEEYQNKYQTNSLLAILLIQFFKTLNVFVKGGDIGFFFYGYQGALVDFLTLILVIWGLWIVLRKFWKNEFFFLIIWLLVIIILGGTLTIDAPSSQRLLALVPALFFLAGLGMEKILNFLKSEKLKNYLVTITMIFIAMINYDAYFNRYVHSDAGWAQKEPATAIAKYLLSLGGNYKVYMLREENSILYFHHGTIRFLAPLIQGTDVSENTLNYIPVKNESGKNLVYIMPPGSKFLSSLYQAYPLGYERQFINPYNQKPWFTSYEIRRDNYNIKD